MWVVLMDLDPLGLLQEECELLTTEPSLWLHSFVLF